MYPLEIRWLGFDGETTARDEAGAAAFFDEEPTDCADLMANCRRESQREIEAAQEPLKTTSNIRQHGGVRPRDVIPEAN
jgi:hypothetical protein